MQEHNIIDIMLTFCVVVYQNIGGRNKLIVYIEWIEKRSWQTDSIEKMSLLQHASDRVPPRTLTLDKICYSFCTLYSKTWIQFRIIIIIYRIQELFQ